MYYFIVNPGSRSGRGKEVWEKIEIELEREDIEYRVYFTSHRFHARELASEITQREGPLTIVAVGGDGTVNEILDGIRDLSKVTFGYIPTGSSNDFSRALGISVSLDAAIENVLHPSYFRKIDIGTFRTGGETHRFGVSCGCGFDAAVCHASVSSAIKDLLNKLHLGKLTYAGTAFKLLLGWKPVRMAIVTDRGEKYSFKRTFFIAAMNGAYEGGGLKMAPGAVPDDGMLDIIIVEGMPKAVIALVLPTAFLGLHAILPGVHIIRARSYKLKTAARQPVHSDGEAYFNEKIMSVSLDKDRLNVISPSLN